MFSSFSYFQGPPGFKGSEGYLGEEGIAVSQGSFYLHLSLKTYLRYELPWVNSELGKQERWDSKDSCAESGIFFCSHCALLLVVISGLLTYCLFFDYPPTLHNEFNAEVTFVTRGVESLLYPPFCSILQRKPTHHIAYQGPHSCIHSSFHSPINPSKHLFTNYILNIYHLLHYLSKTSHFNILMHSLVHSTNICYVYVCLAHDQILIFVGFRNEKNK